MHSCWTTSCLDCVGVEGSVQFYEATHLAPSYTEHGGRGCYGTDMRRIIYPDREIVRRWLGLGRYAVGMTDIRVSLGDG